MLTAQQLITAVQGFQILGNSLTTRLDIIAYLLQQQVPSLVNATPQQLLTNASQFQLLQNALPPRLDIIAYLLQQILAGGSSGSNTLNGQGPPNGVSGVLNQFYVDNLNNILYVNTNGGTGWQAL